MRLNFDFSPVAGYIGAMKLLPIYLNQISKGLLLSLLLVAHGLVPASAETTT